MDKDSKSKRASFLDSIAGDGHQFFELSRSMSAPPAEFLSSIQSIIDDNDDVQAGSVNDVSQRNSVTNDPSYAAYFYSNSRFDPRLPPPNFYSPGQSWQMWPSSGSASGGGNNNTSNITDFQLGSTAAVGTGNMRQRNSFMQSIREKESNSLQQHDIDEEQNSHQNSTQYRKKLVDMIQEDFPRTPSPVHMNNNQVEGSTGIHLLGNQSENSKPLLNRNSAGKKPFSISGSVDAVMAAALEIEGHDGDSDFGFEKLNLLPEEEDEPPVQVMNWNRFTTSSNVNYSEPFVYASSDISGPSFGSYTPSLNSAPARSAGGSSSLNNYTGASGYTPSFLVQAVPVGPSYSLTGYGTTSSIIVENGLKTSIMEDFRMNRSKRYEIADLKGMIIDFSTDQHGSRFIQQKLESASEAEKELVFVELYPMALQLMTDVFGNYVIQKFFEHGSRSQRIALARLMHGHVLTLSLQMYGCRVVQKALEHVPSEEQVRLVQELEGHVLKCVKDQNGNHVIQKCIECVPLNTSAPFLTASFLSQASTLAMHPYGCRVIQRIFEHGPPDHSKALLDELLKNTGVLIQDQYGNYVIQHVLEHGKPHERTRIIQFLQGRLLEYSRHKFASNVVEKCVSFGTEAERQALIEEVLTPISSEAAAVDASSGDDGGLVVPLHLMMRDQFANYVVQKMLEVVDGEQRDLLLACIKPQIHHLRKYTYGKHILAKVERMLGLTPSVPSEPERVTNSNYHSSNTSSREYHSAPNSPASKPQNSFSPSAREYRPRTAAGQHQRISKNDLNEFPLLNSSKRK